MGHNYNHEALLGDLVSGDSFDEEIENQWNPRMFFEWEPDLLESIIEPDALETIIEPKIDLVHDGLWITLASTFLRSYNMIYRAVLDDQEITLNETSDQLRLIFPKNINCLQVYQVTGNLNGRHFQERIGSRVGGVGSMFFFMSDFVSEPFEFEFEITIKYRGRASANQHANYHPDTISGLWPIVNVVDRALVAIELRH